MTKTLFDLLTALSRPQIAGTHGDLTVPITAPVVESDADVEPGGLFVARKGLAVDGHDFIPAAIERGAAAIVGEHDIRDLAVPYIRVQDALEVTGWLAAAYHDFPSRRLVVIGVTGTDGKTTTSILVHAMLKQATGKAGLISTVNADLGDSLADTGLHVTTPGAPQVQALLARMVANGLTYAVVEMTSHGLAQGRLNGVEVDVAILTNIRHEHLDYHGSFENYRAAKGRLFQMLTKSYRKKKQPKISVINTDDPNGDFFAEFAADRVIRYGLTENAEYRATDIHYSPEGTTFRVEYPDDFVFGTTISDTQFFTPLPGTYNVYNALAAVETCMALPVSIRAITEGLRQVDHIPGRMERIDEGQAFTAIVDFAHTPNALDNALNTCRQMLPEGNKLIAVFGSAGLRDREKRRMMAEIGMELADFIILTAEDPRTESLDDILAAMAAACVERGGVEGETFFRVPDRGQALFRACELAQPGDIVIACGKGHEQSMCFGTVEHPWDDREAMRAALRGAPLKTLPTADE
ncbi:MAG: UDP-N-acetylmuramoyl-L-alanyl-D-glutamate--2,6-diaminopimelate ligase [Anaerolineae bacterium]|nr:UDP-N-acetylmuramoyl-L-alanyl-D-glutamate--2,6-diaminopimelate ligase [Anaerolineae bacterium]